MRWTTAEIASAVGGRLVGGDVAVDRVTQDSREIDPSAGSWCFVPLVADAMVMTSYRLQSELVRWRPSPLSRSMPATPS